MFTCFRSTECRPTIKYACIFIGHIHKLISWLLHLWLCLLFCDTKKCSHSQLWEKILRILNMWPYPYIWTGFWACIYSQITVLILVKLNHASFVMPAVVCLCSLVQWMNIDKLYHLTGSDETEQFTIVFISQSIYWSMCELCQKWHWSARALWLKNNIKDEAH